MTITILYFILETKSYVTDNTVLCFKLKHKICNYSDLVEAKRSFSLKITHKNKTCLSKNSIHLTTQPANAKL